MEVCFEDNFLNKKSFLDCSAELIEIAYNRACSDENLDRSFFNDIITNTGSCKKP